jgi:Transposase domain (DUF772)
MRGNELQQSAMFSLSVSRRASPSESPAAGNPPNDGSGSGPIVAHVFADVFPHGTTLDCTRKIAAASAVADALYDSERMLMEQLDYNLLFRWFVGLNMDEGVWDATVFSKNRDRLLEAPM